MLQERSVVEQRYQAVVEVLEGMPVVEVAERYGVSRQSVHAWVGRYRTGGLEALADRSHRPVGCPHQLSSAVEARICELRRHHPGWGPVRLRHELERSLVTPLPSLSGIYRALVRRGLIEPGRRRRSKQDYQRWERDRAMQLWQLDIMGDVRLADGTELKLVTGVDDHSRFCVVAALCERATARAVCAAFAAALGRYGVPEEVLTDNGKQFTGRFGKPRPAEVLFERICRENGITARLTKVKSPTTTGKIERFHKTVRAELLATIPPFPSLVVAQQVIDAWVDDYNHRRPHQALGMATPAERFGEVHAGQVPAALALRLPRDTDPAPSTPTPAPPARPDAPGVAEAVELDVVVPACGNLGLAGQQLWLGPRHAGRMLTVRADVTSIHLSLDGALLKTVPSRYQPEDLARLGLLAGARPAGPPPGPSAALDADAVLAVDRPVNRAGCITLGGHRISVGSQFAGQLVTVRAAATLLHVVAGGILVKTLPSPIPADARARLRGARQAGDLPPVAAGPIAVQRRVGERGNIQVAGQRLQVGLGHAGKLVTVQVTDTQFHVLLDGTPVTKIPRHTNGEVTRHKAYTTKNTPPSSRQCQPTTEAKPSTINRD